MTTANSREIYGQILPLQGIALLLPKVAVVEMQGMDSVTPNSQGPEWFLGFGAWRDYELPVVSLEAMTGASAPPRSRRSRVAVLNSLGSHLANGHFMVVTQGYPQLTVLNSRALQKRPEARECRVTMAQVKLADKQAMIPDLDAIERQISEAIAAIHEAGSADWGRDSALKTADKSAVLLPD